MKTPPHRLAPHPHAHPHPPHRHVPASEIAAFIRPEEIDALLTPWLPDPGERELVVRCLLEVGPAHHRGSNFVLLRMLGLLLARQRVPARPHGSDEQEPIPLRVPPSVLGAPEAHYPLGVPLAALERLTPRDSRSFAAMLDCLTDGPPQHALANAAMLCILESLLAAADAAGDGPR